MILSREVRRQQSHRRESHRALLEQLEDPRAAHFQRSLSLKPAFADDDAFCQRAGLRFGSE